MCNEAVYLRDKDLVSTCATIFFVFFVLTFTIIVRFQIKWQWLSCRRHGTVWRASFTIAVRYLLCYAYSAKMKRKSHTP